MQSKETEMEMFFTGWLKATWKKERIKGKQREERRTREKKWRNERGKRRALHHTRNRQDEDDGDTEQEYQRDPQRETRRNSKSCERGHYRSQ